MIIASNPINNPINCGSPFCTISEKAILAIFINNKSCGIIKGNPKIAIIADGWDALAAMAAKKLNTKLKLMPPKQLMPKNNRLCCNGLPNKMVKSNKLRPLIKTINKLL